ncbi:LLM class flavin-dependent oxidoreductase [Bradyrhizobium elkanii]|uniref:LLM class flavin-dependent oxidoreductase n=1 Tax=Bradyrhizobium elkanii TaxID=29448 RepID=UPI001BAB4C5D|nr:LLM class flavin-dependent oxidoreductase [Bradyrhizobium elkanii]MBR1162032.1 LLM class flavin-dependent oxidoreductase [Bradyrhizobium elkanii]
MRPLEFGWYLPTHGDTTAYGLMEAQIAGSPELCERVVAAAEHAGFEYLLIPVGSVCWEAWIAGAFMAARSRRIKPLIAARPGYINPVLMAKMISTFDQMSGGRICINLIAGQNESEVEAEGVRQPKEERYALMEEEVSILKALWTTRGPVHFQGRFHTISGAHIRPRPLQQPFPKFYLGGGSRQAWEVSAKHSDVHLFWGDLPERVAENIAEIRRMARAHDREDAIGFGMRLQVICRENEADAWEAADQLVRHATERQKQEMKTLYNRSEANQRVQQLARDYGDLLMPHLWTGITKVRPGAGIAVVGNPAQCAATLQQFIDAGCHSFCLSGYLHDEEAERFGRLIRPILAANNRGRLVA